MKKYYSFLLLLIIFHLPFAEGQIAFHKQFNPASVQVFSSVQQTNDSGYITVGYDYGGGATNYLIKTNIYGDTLWTKNYISTMNNVLGNYVLQTTDEGYLIVGPSNSTVSNAFFIKTNSFGDTLWTKSYQIINAGLVYNPVQQTSDGGFILVGTSLSTGSFYFDICLIKTNSSGDTLWSKTYGTAYNDWGFTVKLTRDGGYIILGKNETPSFTDILLIKTNSSGDTLWTRVLGGNSNDEGLCIQQTSDGGFIIGGWTQSFSSYQDGYLIKCDSAGNVLWSKTFRGNNIGVASSVEQTNDGGFIFAGTVRDNNVEPVEDAFLLKINSVGDTLWSVLIGGGDSSAQCAHQTFDGGYIVNGLTFNGGNLNFANFLAKTDSLGSIGCYNFHSPITMNSVQTQRHFSSIALSTAQIGVSAAPVVIGSGNVVSTMCFTNGVTSFTRPNSIIISPNPTSDKIKITNEESKIEAVEIFNLLGEKIFYSSAVNSQLLTIDCELFPQDIYFVRVQTENGSAVQKLIRE